MDAWAIDAFCDVRLAVLLVDDRRVVVTDRLVLVQLLNFLEVRQRIIERIVNSSVNKEVLFLSHWNFSVPLVTSLSDCAKHPRVPGTAGVERGNSVSSHDPPRPHGPTESMVPM